jgi:hypothetical protein
MIVRALFILITVTAGCAPSKKMRQDEGKGIQIVITSTASYCGGARPTMEMEAELATPRPMPNVEVYVRAGTTHDYHQPVIFSGMSDEDGRIRLKLAPGTYSVVTKEKNSDAKFRELLKQYAQETDQWSAIDVDCLNKWFQTPDLVMTVSDDGVSEYSLNIHQPCFWHSVPCANYKGPFPP